jgi:hypothetical protein
LEETSNVHSAHFHHGVVEDAMNDKADEDVAKDGTVEYTLHSREDQDEDELANKWDQNDDPAVGTLRSVVANVQKKHKVEVRICTCLGRHIGSLRDGQRDFCPWEDGTWQQQVQLGFYASLAKMDLGSLPHSAYAPAFDHSSAPTTFHEMNHCKLGKHMAT